MSTHGAKLHFSFSDVLYLLCYFERIQEYPGTTEDQFGGSWGLHGQFCVGVSFREIQNHENKLFNVSLAKIGGVDAESMRGHFPAIGLP